MNALTSTTSKLTALALSAAMTLSLAGAVIGGLTSQYEPAIVQLPSVIIIGHRDGVKVPVTLQADAKPLVKSGA